MGRRTSLFISDEFTVAENTVTVPVSNQVANDTRAFRTFFARKNVLQCQNVCTQRSVCVALILATGILSAYFIHQSTANREEAIFTSQFENLAYILGENFLNTFETKVWTSFSISLTLTSESEHYNKTWPYVMIPYFEQRFQGNREIAKCQNIFFAPLVTDDTRTNWEKFVIQNQDQISVFPDGPSCQVDCPTLSDGILMPFQNESRIQDPGPGPYLPVIFITTNDTNTGNRLIMTNLYHSDAMEKLYNTAIFNGTSVLSDMKKRDTSPASILITPVFDGISNARKAVGILQIDIEWRTSFEPLASPLDGSVVVVLKTGLEEVVTFEILGGEVIFLGEGDHHDQKYSRYGVTAGISTENLKDESKLRLSMWRNALFKYGIIKDFNSTYTGRFAYNITFYPTESLESGIKTNLPVIYSVATSIIFLFVIIIFTAFDKLIDTRKKLEKDASNAPSPLLSTLIRPFPQNRLMENDLNASRQLPQRWSTMSRRMSNDETIRVAEPAKSRLRAFLNRSENTNRAEMEQYQFEDPIADLFPETTIMFADISGFTAWSSEREPSQIFYLLETLYRAFDQLASELGVFKVETIGDCYVAVTGLPDPNKDHALIMARFAHECLLKMNELVKSLEVSLGPGTSDLAIRVGLHSGPVTAGVLRGEKSRFQLFGDTMNTASRMESTGTRNKIHVSEDTAVLLKRGGKEDWLVERDGLVNAKGKGKIKTWWLHPRQLNESLEAFHHRTASEQNISALEAKPRTQSSVMARRSSKSDDGWGGLDLNIYGVDADKKARLVNWNVELFGELLSKVVIWRSIRAQPQSRIRRSESSFCGLSLESDDSKPTSALEEVSEVIRFPTFSETSTLLGALVPDVSRISDKVKGQLHSFILRIANCYRNVPFHNLEHASHVTLSANKLMKRILSPAEADFKQPQEIRRRMGRRKSIGDIHNNLESVERNLHNSTFGISSDPLCQLAIVFSALIHDVDHTGVPNAQLVKENAPIAAKYNNRSVAEQNSVDIAWSILMEVEFQDLRDCIFENEVERRRFRQLVVNSVMATDIVDKELKLLRDNRWATAFHGSNSSSMSNVDIDRKATIVIEHIIQASDVAHTMQHWHIYSKWNEKLFCEMYTAYLAGRAANDPSEGWYGGEIWFFDNYIIPLAKKLKECGVFGVTSDEYLGFALENREEWVLKGKSVVAAMIKSFKQRHGGLAKPIKNPLKHDKEIGNDLEGSTNGASATSVETTASDDLVVAKEID